MCQEIIIIKDILVKTCLPHSIKIFQVHHEKKQLFSLYYKLFSVHLLLWHYLKVGKRDLRVVRGTGSAITQGRGQCCHPALSLGQSLRIQAGALAKSLPVFSKMSLKPLRIFGSG